MEKVGRAQLLVQRVELPSLDLKSKEGEGEELTWRVEDWTGGA